MLETLAYFEQFERALLPEELHPLLWNVAAFSTAVNHALQELVEAKIVIDAFQRKPRALARGQASPRLKAGRDLRVNAETPTVRPWEFHNDHVGLSAHSISATKRRQSLISKRRQSALAIARILSRVPGIISVILMNSTAMQTLSKASDIDFLIICAPDSIHVARTLALIFLKSKGLAKTKHDHAGKACLGYWLSEHDLSVSQYQTEMHTAVYWIATMVPLYGIEGYKKFIQANDWIHDYLPNWQEHEQAHLRYEGSAFRVPRLKRLNSIFYPLHRWKVMRDPEFATSRELVCTPDRLKLHSVDKRPGYGDKMQSILDLIR